MKTVHQQQTRHEIVGGEGRQHLVVQPAVFVHQAEQPLETGAVEVRDEPDQLLAPFAGDGSACGAGGDQCVDTVAGRPPVGGPGSGLLRHHSLPADWVGECSSSSFLPSPRYMCTPQGRQGSKLRTVRMMSMPLKCSRSFSSKIGWPCTASS